MHFYLFLAAGLLSLTTTAHPTTRLSLPEIPSNPSRRADDASSISPRAISYVQTFHTTDGGNLSILPIRTRDSRLSHIYLSAVHINANPGDITLNDNNPNDTYWDSMWSQAADLQSRGVVVMMMLGGAARGSYPRLCSGDPTGEDDTIVINDDYYIPLLQTLRYHKIQGLDLDIEERVDISCPLALLQRLYADLGPKFILTMAPVATDLQPRQQGLSGVKYKDLDAAATAADKPNGKLINWFNVQFYNGWGNAASPVGYNAIINNGYDPSRVVLGVLDSPSDGGSGWYNLSTYTNTTRTLKATYPSYNSIVSWEYYDAGLGDEEDYTTDAYGTATPGNGTYENDPWTWDKAMADVVLGPNAGPAGARPDTTASPIPAGESPWPAAMKSIMALTGGDWVDAIWALNQTAGDLEQALGLLGLLSDVL